jgi:23S rRNA C2498 (ribose-2'-O)-methylase RlmM
MWPCCPRETAGFIEKAAQTMFRKFGSAMPHAILTGPLDPDASNRYYKTLASNLRGRLLQLFPPDVAAIRELGPQHSRLPALYGLVGREGLFCGIQSPLESNGFYPGGTKFISQSSPGMISRAGAKLAEALHYLTLHRSPPPAGSHWLELGASPGGMTAELLARDYQVTALDRAPMDARLSGASGLRIVRMDAAAYMPPAGTVFDAILSDMNGDALESIERVSRFASYLRPGGLVVFTLKMPGISGLEEITALEVAVTDAACAAGLLPFATTHLTYNRHEFTMFLERGEKPISRVARV